MPKDIIQTTIRLSKELWLKLRRLEEEGKIKSIHDGILRGIDLLLKKEIKKNARD